MAGCASGGERAGPPSCIVISRRVFRIALPITADRSTAEDSSRSHFGPGVMPRLSTRRRASRQNRVAFERSPEPGIDALRSAGPTHRPDRSGMARAREQRTRPRGRSPCTPTLWIGSTHALSVTGSACALGAAPPSPECCRIAEAESRRSAKPEPPRAGQGARPPRRGGGRVIWILPLLIPNARLPTTISGGTHDGTLTGRERAELTTSSTVRAVRPSSRSFRRHGCPGDPHSATRPPDGFAARTMATLRAERRTRGAAGVLAESRGAGPRWWPLWAWALAWGLAKRSRLREVPLRLLVCAPQSCTLSHPRGDGRVITWALRMAGHDPRRRAYLGRRHLFGHPCRWLSCGGWAFPPFRRGTDRGRCSFRWPLLPCGRSACSTTGQDGRMGPFQASA